MPHKTAVLTNELSGVPYIRLSRPDIWKLRQYFAWQDVQTEEHFENDTITVQFPKMKPDEAQRLLDGWRLSHEVPRPALQRRASPQNSRANIW